MTHLAKTTKILEFFNKTIIEQLEEFYQLLLAGDLRTYESKLNESLIMIQELINEELLPIAAKELLPGLVVKGRALGGRKIEGRPLSIRTASGQAIVLPSAYVKQPGSSWRGCRHLLGRYWNIIGGASPLLFDKVC